MSSLVYIFELSFIQRHIITCKLHGWATLGFAVVLVVRGLLIVTSYTNCDVTSCPVDMRRYANAAGDEQRCKKSKTQISLPFFKMWSWSNRNWPLIRSALSCLVLQSGTALVVPAASNRATTARRLAQLLLWLQLRPYRSQFLYPITRTSGSSNATPNLSVSSTGPFCSQN